jgi:hypothetical protein
MIKRKKKRPAKWTPCDSTDWMWERRREVDFPYACGSRAEVVRVRRPCASAVVLPPQCYAHLEITSPLFGPPGVQRIALAAGDTITGKTSMGVPIFTITCVALRPL